MRGVVQGIEQRAAAAEARVLRFARQVSELPQDAAEAELREFDRLVARESDGAWRSRRSLFDASRHAGLFIPRDARPSPDFKAFLIRAKQLTERFGAGALDPTLADAWISPVEGGQVMYVPDQPNFPWENSATEDYRNTEWMRLAEPDINPAGTPRWTEPYHSVKTDAWFVSVVAPFTRQGRWGGSVGQDLSWQVLVDYSAQTPAVAGGGFLLIGPNGGVLVADSGTARNPARPEGRRLVDLPDVELRDTLTRMLGTIRAGAATAETQLARTSRSYVLWSGVPRTGWLVATVLPAAG
ncbi:MAG TPA: hypothetical protein VLB00_08495, partial [Gemmatimonadales bacterium]|nr:hypothetical protein [Gemmatimonadales bacterium]